MEYKFVRLKCNHYNMEYPWILECKDIETLIEHTEKYMNTEIERGVKDWFKSQKGHLTTNYASAVEKMMIFTGNNFIKESTIMENKIFQGKLKMLLKFGTLYLRENGSYMVHSDSLIIIDKKVMDEMVWPEYTVDDIKISKWDGGSHYYAKIGRMDVTDADGNVKWNTHKEAKRHALVFFENLIN